MSDHSPHPAASSTLAEMPAGSRARILRLAYPAPDISRRLRELGFRENAVVHCIIRGNGNLICEVRNMRIGIDRRIARAIIVAISPEEGEQCN